MHHDGEEHAPRRREWTRGSTVGNVTSFESKKRRLARPRGNRWIAGVCSGLAYRFGLPPNLIRLIFVLSCLLPGPQFLIYIILWAIIPNEAPAEPPRGAGSALAQDRLTAPGPR